MLGVGNLLGIRNAPACQVVVVVVVVVDVIINE